MALSIYLNGSSTLYPHLLLLCFCPTTKILVHGARSRSLNSKEEERRMLFTFLSAGIHLIIPQAFRIFHHQFLNYFTLQNLSSMFFKSQDNVFSCASKSYFFSIHICLQRQANICSYFLDHFCRFLEGTNCVGMCTNLCKVPSEKFIWDSLGMPVYMVPSKLYYPSY